MGVALSPDGRTLVSTSTQEGLSFWDVSTGSYIARFPGYGGENPRITSDGRLLVMINPGRQAVEVWDMQTRAELGHGDPIAYGPSGLAISGDGRLAVTGGRRLSVWRTRPGHRRNYPAAVAHKCHRGRRCPAAGRRRRRGRHTRGLSPRYRRLALGQCDWTRNKSLARTRARHGRSRPGGRRRGDSRLAIRRADHADPGLAQRVRACRRGGPSEGHLAATASDGTISVWDLERHRLRYRIRTGHYDAKALAVTPDGTVLVSLADTGRIRRR